MIFYVNYPEFHYFFMDILYVSLLLRVVSLTSYMKNTCEAYVPLRKFYDFYLEMDHICVYYAIKWIFQVIARKRAAILKFSCYGCIAGRIIVKTIFQIP